jgi:hypothetical protein
MAAALKYLSQMTDAIFASQMERAAIRICERQHIFRHAGR